MGVKSKPLDTRAMARDIRKMLDSATTAQIAEGTNWYPAANAEVLAASTEFGLPIMLVAAVFSAFSARTFWSVNKRAAWQFLSDGTRATGVLTANYRRAQSLMSADMSELGAVLYGTQSPKLVCFWLNILGNDEWVTVDSWAARIALPRLYLADQARAASAKSAAVSAGLDPGGVKVTSDVNKALGRVGGYAAISAAYRKVAADVNMPPAVVQAITWCVIRGKGE